MVKPSQIGQNFLELGLGNIEMNAWAFWLLLYCCENGDSFDQEIEWKAFDSFIKSKLSDQSIPYMHWNQFEFNSQQLINKMHDLVAQGYVEKDGRDGHTYFKVTSNLVNLYKKFYQQPA